MLLVWVVVVVLVAITQQELLQLVAVVAVELLYPYLLQ
jgi:hypothetical protein